LYHIQTAVCLLSGAATGNAAMLTQAFMLPDTHLFMPCYVWLAHIGCWQDPCILYVLYRIVL
jgi:hypothetical protein